MANRTGRCGNGTLFQSELRRRLGEQVAVTTTCGGVSGRLERIGNNYIVLGRNGRQISLRIASICHINGNG